MLSLAEGSSTMRLHWHASSVVRLGAFSGCLAFACSTALAQAAAPQTAAPTQEDNPIYAAFSKLQKNPAYHMHITMQSNDPGMAQAAAMGLGFGPMDKVVEGDTSQVTMHMKLPAFDTRGMVDDWEVRVVSRNGRAARMFSSPAIPRLMKLSQQIVTMEMAMLDKQASMAIAHALAEGPAGAIRAGMLTGETMAMNVLAAREFKKQENFFNWQCMDQSGGDTAAKASSQLADIKAVADEVVDGKAASAYEFYVDENGQRQGPVHLAVAKDSGLPLRIHMNDPGGHGSMDLAYDLETSGNIETPKCLAENH
jgi:hypothetical protein